MLVSLSTITKFFVKSMVNTTNTRYDCLKHRYNGKDTILTSFAIEVNNISNDTNIG